MTRPDREKLQAAHDRLERMLDLGHPIVECVCGEQLDTDPECIHEEELQQIRDAIWEVLHLVPGVAVGEGG